MPCRITPIPLIECLSVVPDPRQEINKKHLLIDILVITLCAVVAGAEGWNEIEAFGEEKEDVFRQFLALPHGIPCHDVFRDVFMRLEPEPFGNAFLRWIQGIQVETKGKFLAIDGKTLRRTLDQSAKRAPFHLVNAWETENGLAMGQVAVNGKSNEITAIPKLLDVLRIEGCTVTIDAMGCQTKIADLITKRKGHYIFAVKENQKGLYQDITDFFKISEETGFDGVEHEMFETLEKDHGRIERRTYYLSPEICTLDPKRGWPSLGALGMVRAVRQSKGETSVDRRYFITSHKSGVAEFAKGVRGHWQVENKLHWVLDVNFHEDLCRKRKDVSAINFAWIRKMAINLLRKDTSRKDSLRRKRLIAAWNTEYLLKVVFGC
jgi:predicted transposase YbfD/YdcC